VRGLCAGPVTAIAKAAAASQRGTWDTAATRGVLSGDEVAIVAINPVVANTVVDVGVAAAMRPLRDRRNFSGLLGYGTLPPAHHSNHCRT